MSNFDKLYETLESILYSRCIADINRFEFEYFDERVSVEFRYSDKMFYVCHVKSLTGMLDYAYTQRTMELYTWLLRPDMRLCEVELEKLIISLVG